MAEDLLGFDLHILFRKAIHRQAGIFAPEKIMNGSFGHSGEMEV